MGSDPLMTAVGMLVATREQAARTVEAIDRALAELDPLYRTPNTPDTALGGRKPGHKWDGGNVACRFCTRSHLPTPGAARSHERQAHPAEFAEAEGLQFTGYPCPREGCDEICPTRQSLGGHAAKHAAADRRAVAAGATGLVTITNPQDHATTNETEPRPTPPVVMVPSGLPKRPINHDAARRAAFEDVELDRL